MTNLIGQTLGRYQLLEQLGEGGMATVYKAYDTRLETDVAVKVIRTEELSPKVLERALKRFEREAKSLAKLTHANIVKVTDYGEYEGSPYLVMTYLPGGTLKEKLSGKPMAWQEAIKTLLPIARALSYAHQEGMIHRDVKPSNILITHSGDPMLTDFGIAKIIDEESTLDLTGTSAAVGTPEYMAPEQVISKTVDQRADIYALGIVFYEMVTGRRPFTADTPMAVLFKHASEPLPRPKQFAPNLPDGVEKVLFKALAKKPEERYQNMITFAEALEGLLTGKQASEVPLPRRAVQEKMAVQDLKVERRTQEASPPAQPRRSHLGLIGAGMVGIAVITSLATWLVKGSATLVPTRTPTTTFTPSATNTPRVTSTPSATDTPSDTATPLITIGATWTRPADDMLMMYVPAGEFLMGSEEGATDEQPVHTVYLDAFWMDQTEVTNRMYVICMDAGECKDPGDGKRSSAVGYPNHPASGNWEMANTYCTWVGGRLPTEAEWEKAARGGLAGKEYPWGDESPTCQKGAKNGAQFRSCGTGTKEVKTFAPNGYGLYDMAGNILEWVMDRYDSNYYSNSPSSNPQGPTSGYYRVLRGGSGTHYVFWGGSRSYLDSSVRASYRFGYDPSLAGLYFGFRCSRSP